MSIRQMLNNIILHFPTLFIKQYPYAWIAAIALWTWPPNISAVFLLIVVIGIFSLRWREAAWISEIRRQHAPKNETFYIDRIPVPIERAVRNIAILIAGGGLLAWFLDGLFNLTFWQTFIMLVGFFLFYVDTRFFGAVSIYIVTGGGIAIYFVPGHTDYRIFIRFNEMGQIVRMNRIEKQPESWSALSRVHAGYKRNPARAALCQRLYQGFGWRSLAHPHEGGRISHARPVYACDKQTLARLCQNKQRVPAQKPRGNSLAKFANYAARQVGKNRSDPPLILLQFQTARSEKRIHHFIARVFQDSQRHLGVEHVQMSHTVTSFHELVGTQNGQ